MIIGIGSDLVDIRRIEKLIGDHEERFIERCFTDAEKETANGRKPEEVRINAYAKRFAAKEACAKALGTGFVDGIFLKDIGVVTLPSGAPTLELSGGAKKRLEAITPQGKEASIHLSLTDEPPMAQAFVIIEAR